MTIGTPTTVVDTYITAAGSSETLTTVADIVAGNFLVLISLNPTSGTGVDTNISSISDGVNTYTRAIRNDDSYNECEVWYCSGASFVASGSTITVNFSVAPNLQNRLSLFQMSGVNAFDSGKQAHSQGNASGAAVVGCSTGTLSTANEIVFGCTVDYRNSNTLTYTEASGFTNLVNRSATGAGNNAPLFGIGYQIVSATTPVDYFPTITASSGFDTGFSCAVFAFKGKPSAGGFRRVGP